jgi:hypothetical protein
VVEMGPASAGRLGAGLVVVGAGRVVGVGTAVVDGAAVVAVLVLDPVGADPEELVGVAGRGVVGDAGVAGRAAEERDGIVGVVDDRRGWGNTLVQVLGVVDAGVVGGDDDADGWCSCARGAGNPGTWTTPA